MTVAPWHLNATRRSVNLSVYLVLDRSRGICKRALLSFIQSAWSKKRDGCSLALECHEKKCQPFRLSGVGPVKNELSTFVSFL